MTDGKGTTVGSAGGMGGVGDEKGVTVCSVINTTQQLSHALLNHSKFYISLNESRIQKNKKQDTSYIIRSLVTMQTHKLRLVPGDHT